MPDLQAVRSSLAGGGRIFPGVPEPGPPRRMPDWKGISFMDVVWRHGPRYLCIRSLVTTMRRLPVFRGLLKPSTARGSSGGGQKRWNGMGLLIWADECGDRSPSK